MRFQKVTGVDTDNFAAKSDVASLNAEVEKTYIDKLKIVPLYLYKLHNVVDNDVFYKTVHDELFPKVNAIDISGFISKTQYNTDKPSVEENINDTD